MEEDQPHSFLRTSTHPYRPKRRHSVLLTAKHQQGIFPVLMNTWIRWLFCGERSLHNSSVSSLLCPTWHRLLILHMGLPVAIKSSTIYSEPCSIWSGKTQERCLSPEHPRHWMLWSTEDTKTLKCISFSFLMKPECFKGHSSHITNWKQTYF